MLIAMAVKEILLQLAAPVIQWPAGVEGFNPIVRDSLNHDHSPLSGKRVFYYRFVSAKPGNYRLPGVNFSFFKLDSNKYKTIATQPMTINIGNSEKSKPGINKEEKRHVSNSGDTREIAWIAGILAIILVSVFYWVKKSRNSSKPQPVVEITRTFIPVGKILQPAITFSEADNITFYTVLRKCIWNFFAEHFGLTGSSVNKNSILKIMNQKGIGHIDQERILEILNRCEVGMFTNADDTADKKQLIKETKELLEHIALG